MVSSQPGCVSEWGTRSAPRIILTQAMWESQPAAPRSRFTGSVTPARASSSTVAHKPHAQALGTFKSIRVQIAIYRPWNCFTPMAKRAQTLLHPECAAGPVESERCRALEHVEATTFLVAHWQRSFSSASSSKERPTVMCFHRPLPGLGSALTEQNPVVGGPKNTRSFFTVI